jgi:phospholipase D-like protein
VDISDLLPLLIPLVVLQVGLLVWALIDLTRPCRRVRGDSKAVWALIIVFISFFGPLLYFIVGREA